jgi:hypothetical protein
VEEGVGVTDICEGIGKGFLVLVQHAAIGVGGLDALVAYGVVGGGDDESGGGPAKLGGAKRGEDGGAADNGSHSESGVKSPLHARRVGAAVAPPCTTSSGGSGAWAAVSGGGGAVGGGSRDRPIIFLELIPQDLLLRLHRHRHGLPLSFSYLDRSNSVYVLGFRVRTEGESTSPWRLGGNEGGEGRRSRKESAVGAGGGAREAHGQQRWWKEEEERRSCGEDGAHSGRRASH